MLAVHDDLLISACSQLTLKQWGSKSFNYLCNLTVKRKFSYKWIFTNFTNLITQASGLYFPCICMYAVCGLFFFFLNWCPHNLLICTNCSTGPVFYVEWLSVLWSCCDKDCSITSLNVLFLSDLIFVGCYNIIWYSNVNCATVKHKLNYNRQYIICLGAHTKKKTKRNKHQNPEGGK